MKRPLARSVMMCLCLVLLPAAAYAQASITGVVKDTSGAVLPGVTVEASSPVLTEKTRSTVTDGSGLYQIIQLLPGDYTVTFTLQGFNTFKRDKIELTRVVRGHAERRHEGRQRGRNHHHHRRDAARGYPERCGPEGRHERDRRRHPDRSSWHQPRRSPARNHPGGGWRRRPGQHQRARVAGCRRHGRRHVHRPGDPRRQAGRTAADHRRSFGRDDHSLRRIAEQLAQLYGDAGDDRSIRPAPTRRSPAEACRSTTCPATAATRSRAWCSSAARTARCRATNYSTGTRDASGNCTPIESLFCRGLVTQPGALKTVYDFNPGYGGPDRPGQAVVVLHGSMDEGGELTFRTTIPT